jgi:hypothetical protein
VSYHVRMLRDYDCVELVRTEPRRGALQHFYRATARPILDQDQWRTLPSGLRRELSGETIAEVVEDLRAAAEAGTLDDPETIVTRTPIELDERAFKKLNRLLARTTEQALAIASGSAGRQGENSSDVFPTELAILHFKLAQPGPPTPARSLVGSARTGPSGSLSSLGCRQGRCQERFTRWSGPSSQLVVRVACYSAFCCWFSPARGLSRCVPTTPTSNCLGLPGWRSWPSPC